MAWARGEIDLPAREYHPPEKVDIEPIRKRLGLTQANFARVFGLNVGTVRDWEQGSSSSPWSRARSTTGRRSGSSGLIRERAAAWRALASLPWTRSTRSVALGRGATMTLARLDDAGSEARQERGAVLHLSSAAMDLRRA